MASDPSKHGPWLFGSLFLGGFECSNHITTEGRRLDLIAATQHDRRARTDYELCRSVGITAVREAARWPVIDQDGNLALDEVRRLARLGRELGIVQAWDLMHYGYPDDLDPFAPEFRERFAAYAGAVAAVVREETEGQTWYTPINEISYYCWAGGEVGYMAPFGQGRGAEFKRLLVSAAIAAADAIWRADPGARMMNVDPLVRVHPPPGRPDLQMQAAHFNEVVVNEAFDMLSGRLEPALGGSRDHLGVVGLNYYAGNQWTIGTPDQPQRFMSPDEPSWIPLADLLAELEARYGGPLVIAETGAAGEARPGWLRHVTAGAARAMQAGVDLQGICLYPIITSPDWEDPTAFFDGGVFDLRPRPGGALERVLSGAVAGALREAQAELDPTNLPTTKLAEIAAPSPQPELEAIRPLETVRLKADNFSYETLAAGEHLQIEVYGLRPGAGIPPHRHWETEHVLTVLSGQATVHVGGRAVTLRAGESVLIPAGLYYGIGNDGVERLVLQQVSGPKPWDARFSGPHPSTIGAQAEAEET